MPEILVAQTFLSRFLMIGLAIALLVVPNIAQTYYTQHPTCAKANSGYDPKTPIDRKTAGEFVKFWMKLAFDYSPETSKKSHYEASLWNSSDKLTNQLNSTFWTKDLASPPSNCELFEVLNVQYLDQRTAGVTACAAFSWCSIGYGRIPIDLYFVVTKEADGYRMNSVCKAPSNQNSSNPYRSPIKSGQSKSNK